MTRSILILAPQDVFTVKSTQEHTRYPLLAIVMLTVLAPVGLMTLPALVLHSASDLSMISPLASLKRSLRLQTTWAPS